MATFTTMPKLTLPYTLSGTQVEAVFEAADPLGGNNAGVVMSSMTHVLQGTTVETNEALAATGFIQSMWWLKGLEFDQEGRRFDVEARPGVGTNQATFDAYGPFIDGNSKSVMFEWRGVNIGSAKVSVRLVAKLKDATADDKIEWHGYVFRANTSRVVLTEFVYPLTILKGFSSVRGGDSGHIEAQARTRFLTPIAFNGIAGFHQFSNHPFNAFAASGIVQEKCPQTLKMPWLCWCSGNDLGPEFRMNFAIRMKRSAPHQSRSWWQWIRDSGNAYMLGGVSHIIREARDFANEVISPGEFRHFPPASSFENTFASPDPTLTEMFISQSNDFWHDICERHRNDYVAAAQPVTLREDDSKTAFSKKPRIFLAMWVNTQDPVEEDQGIRNYREHAELMQLIYANDDGVSVKGSIAHQQIHQRGFGGGVFGETLPRELYADEALYIRAMEDELPLMRQAGWLLSLYLIPSWVFGRRSWNEPLRNAGEPGLSIFSDRIVDLLDTDPAVFQAWLDNVVDEVIGDHNLRGFLHDTYSGAARSVIRLREKGDRDPRRWVTGGGDGDSERRAENFMASRLRMQNLFAGTPEEVTLIAENTEEWVDKYTDVSGPGYYYPPDHFICGESAAATFHANPAPFFDPLSIKTDYPSSFRNLNPGLSRIVHHAHSYTFWFSMNFMMTPLKTYQQSKRGPSADGLTGDEYVDASCYQRALILHNGCTVQMLTAYTDGENYTPILRYDKTLNQVVNADPSIDTTNAGATIADFARTLFTAGAEGFGEEWLIDGQRERPMDVDYDSAAVQKENNPFAPYSKLTSFQTGEIEQYNNAPFFGTLELNLRLGNNDHPVPAVLSSVWRSTDGRLMVMLINWTRSVADWFGSFSPGSYSMNKLYDVEQINKGAPSTVLATGLSGVSTWESAGSSSEADVYLGHLPAHSVNLFEIIRLP